MKYLLVLCGYDNQGHHLTGTLQLPPGLPIKECFLYCINNLHIIKQKYSTDYKGAGFRAHNTTSHMQASVL